MSWDKDIHDPDSPQSASSAVLATNIVIPGVLRVYGFTVTNTKGSAQLAQWFDASALPADGVVPIASKNVPTVDAVGVFFGDCGRVFHRGIVICNSSTSATKTIGSADCLFDVQYELLHQ